MKNYFALREKPNSSSHPDGSPLKKGDVLVLFGELFPKGYANGLVAEAQKAGLKIIYATVGRREKDGELRALTHEELESMPRPLINVPLEAGFDLQKSSRGNAPTDFLKDVKLSQWQEAKIDFTQMEESKQLGRKRFVQNVQTFLQQLRSHIPAGSNVLFAHLMAGGVPRTKIVMPLMNRSFKGTGDRFLSSELFWSSDIGKFCAESFFEVSAETFRILIEQTAEIRSWIESQGGKAHYLGYGYHGTEILQNDRYRWQTYSPYLQGWAKMRLEDYARQARSSGFSATVYNCPEILTASSSIFQGVEVCLYSLLGAIQKDSKNKAGILDHCRGLLKSEISIEKLMQTASEYLDKPEIKETCIYEKWPQHNTQKQLETLLNTSETLFTFHKNEKEQLSPYLSELVVRGCGELMFASTGRVTKPVVWLNHDVIAKCF